MVAWCLRRRGSRHGRWPGLVCIAAGRNGSGWRMFGSCSLAERRPSPGLPVNAGEAVGRFTFCGEGAGREAQRAHALKKVVDTLHYWMLTLPIQDAEAGSTLTRWQTSHYVHSCPSCIPVVVVFPTDVQSNCKSPSHWVPYTTHQQTPQHTASKDEAPSDDWHLVSISFVTMLCPSFYILAAM